MLTLISYAFGTISAVALIACLASGLSQVCTWIEDHPTRSKNVGVRLAQATTLVSALITFSDGLPFTFLLTNATAQLVICLTQTERMASVNPTIRVAVQCLTPLVPHLILLHRFHPGTHHALLTSMAADAHQAKERWPGGRLDWDAYATGNTVRIYGSAEQLSCFALCWLSTLWNLLAAIAVNWSLPFAANERHAKLTRSK